MINYCVYILEDSITGFKYIGSKKNYEGIGTYFGSLCASKSHKKYDIQQQWIMNTKLRPETFTFTVLEEYDEIEYRQLMERELHWQKKLNAVKSHEYVNAGYAKLGWCDKTGYEPWNKGLTIDSDEVTRLAVQKMKSVLAKKRESGWDPRTGKKHSEETKKVLSEMRKGNPKYSGKNHPRRKAVIIEGIRYETFSEASKKLGIPQPTITYRCNSDNFTDYNYETK